MTTMHPRYREARNRIRDLPLLHPSLFDQTITINIRWREAFDKDPTGLQCVRYVDDLVERITPMRR